MTFEIFFNDSLGYVSGKGYQIVDINLFREVVNTFYFKA